MSTTANEILLFHLFQDLAPELRDQIWRAALPDQVKPALYFYQKGGWRPQRVLLSDERYSPENDNSDVTFEFHHNLIDAVQINIPLFFVNREARDAALAWICEHNIGTRVYPNENGQPQSPVFVSPFDPKHDALYITHGQWEEFAGEPDTRCLKPDMVDKYTHITAAAVTHIALPETLFRNDSETAADLAEIMDRWFNQIRVLSIIVDTPSNLQPASDGMNLQPRWGLEHMKGGTFFWNYDRRSFDFSKSEHVIDQILYEQVVKINSTLGGELIQNNIHSFEIRLVFAIKI